MEKKSTPRRTDTPVGSVGSAGFNTKTIRKTKAKPYVPEVPEVQDSVDSDPTLGGFSTGSAKKIKKADGVHVPTGPQGSRQWSTHQAAIFDACESTNSSLIIEALAGTGKTTTVIEAVKHLKGKVLLCAFNKRIADELAGRVGVDGGDLVHVSTLHGLGYRLVQRTFPNTQVDNMRGLATALASLKRVGGPIAKSYQWMVKDAMAICKEISPYLISSESHPDEAAGKVAEIAFSYGHFDRIDPRYVEVSAQAVLEGMRQSLVVTGSIDYSDMLFVPLHKIASSGEYDAVIVDEAQDMNASQLYLAQQVLKASGRLIVVGDRHQAIYGFRGADTGSMDRLREKFKATVLKLPVSYRCPKSIITEAQRFVPDIEAAPDAPVGSVQYLPYSRMVREAGPGDFILSRLNAPLLRLCLMFIKEGRSAVVEGRDIGKGLVNVINKMTFGNPTVSIPSFLQSLKVWAFKTSEMALAKDDAERAQQVGDQSEALQILAEDCTSMADLKSHIERLFDDTGGKSSKIVCSTVHKAKGLESNRVFILCDTFKGGWDGGTGEEANLKYVAVTRSKSVLSYVDHPNPPEGERPLTNPKVLNTQARNDFDAPF